MCHVPPTAAAFASHAATAPAEMAASVEAAAKMISQRWPVTPKGVLILGTGMGPLSAELEIELEIPYGDLPGFQASTAPGHVGRLLCGTLCSLPIIAMQGRWHRYEGYRTDEVALPVHVFHRLGAERLILTNASGGLNPLYQTGEVMLIDDHLNFMFQQPVSLSEHRLGRTCYDRQLIDQAKQIARRHNFVAHLGTYAAMTGPNYETRAEYRMLRRLGADVVGMSTVPEVLAAAKCGMPSLGISIVTNTFRDDGPHQTTAEEVIYDATLALPQVRTLVRDLMNSAQHSPDL